MSQKELKVSALENGTVLDHIPAENVYKALEILGLRDIESPITIGINLASKQHGKKGIIKIADKFFSDDEINQLSVVAPNVTLSTIRDYEVVEKKEVHMPEELIGIVRCDNHKCITNNEPMHTRFHFLGRERGTLQCHYCNREISLSDVKLV